jgi:phosphoribosylanthranilate isomerase
VEGKTVKVKVCGITNLDDALAAVDYGADALGFVFYRGSPRFIPPADAASLIRKLPPFVQTVGVFVNEVAEDIRTVAAMAGIGLVQLHGEEPPEACRVHRRIIKAIRVKSLESLSPLEQFKDHVSAFLLDAYSPDNLGGTGIIFNWDIAVEAKPYGKIILAGGLTPDNVGDAIRRVKPYGVDVSSGVELTKGKKDLQKMKLFIERAKGAL